ncbi:MAG TPA: hypothetical protein VH252_06375 [Chthoniobacterales bacterium]|nr:hypothetical protein [Chthoniobacterales bacterium]
MCAAVAMTSAAFAGETYSKESKSVTPPPCPQWYADNEFNVTLSGVYAWTGNDYRDDQYLATDHAWGGALDAKYFVHRYFGFGVQGWVAHANTQEFFDAGFGRVAGDSDSHAVGGVLGTFTLRFPISCSRFAPYFWLGGGGVFGGGRDHDFFLSPTTNLPVRREFDDSHTRSVGQVGGGFEVRFTPHIGWTNDVSWNVVSGPDNNFGMARTGINFAF